MHINVLNYEPHLALFVPDEDALMFYRAIAGFGKTHLNTGGKIYVEINQFYSDSTAQMFKDFGYQSVQIKKGFFGKSSFYNC